MTIDELIKFTESHDVFDVNLGISSLNSNYDVSEDFKMVLRKQFCFGGFKKCIRLGGMGQGDFISYSSIVFWKQGKNQYPKGSISYVQSCSVYFSHLVPVAIVVFGETIYKRKSTIASDIGFQKETVVEGSSVPHSGWEEFFSTLKTELESNKIQVLDFNELSNNYVSSFTYISGLELDPPKNLLCALFHGGIDYDY